MLDAFASFDAVNESGNADSSFCKHWPTKGYTRIDQNVSFRISSHEWEETNGQALCVSVDAVKVPGEGIADYELPTLADLFNLTQLFQE